MQPTDRELPPKPRSDLVETEFDADLAIYDPAREHVVMLNGPAADVWRLLDGATGISEVIELLARAYSIEPAAIADDVRTAVALLTDAGLIEP